MIFLSAAAMGIFVNNQAKREGNCSSSDVLDNDFCVCGRKSFSTK